MSRLQQDFGCRILAEYLSKQFGCRLIETEKPAFAKIVDRARIAKVDVNSVITSGFKEFKLAQKSFFPMRPKPKLSEKTNSEMTQQIFCRKRVSADDVQNT